MPISARRSVGVAFVLCAACSSGGGGGYGMGGAGGGAPQTPVVHGLRIDEVAIYQAVKVPLVVGGQPSERSTPVAQGRAALLRVFVSPEPDWQPREVVARLEIERNGSGLPVQEVAAFVAAASSDADLASAFNFQIAAADVTGDFEYRVGLYESTPTPLGDATPGAIFPDQGKHPLGAMPVGTLEIVLVPIEYRADGSNRLPTLGPAEQEALRARMFRTYPVAAVNLSTRAPLPWSYTVSAFGNGWSELLQHVMSTRSKDNVPDNVYYYGAFRPTDSFYQYCQQGCVAGLSAGGVGPNDDWARASLGVLYDADHSADTFIHEVGHAHGRDHAPCAPYGQIDYIDPGYPYPGAEIGSWGYDLLSQQLIQPGGSFDFMSYCDPSWISDYTYRALFDRISFLNAAARFRSGAPRAYRMLSVAGDGELTAGPELELRRPPSGERRNVRLMDAASQPLGDAEAAFHPYPHLPGGILLVPEPAGEVRRLGVGTRTVELRRD
jgi:hypothetical protein